MDRWESWFRFHGSKKKIFCRDSGYYHTPSTKTFIGHIPDQPVVHEFKDGKRNLPFYYQYVRYGRKSSKSKRLNSATFFKTKKEAEIAAKKIWNQNRYTCKKKKVNYAEVSQDDIDITVLKANLNTLNASEKSTYKSIPTEDRPKREDFKKMYCDDTYDQSKVDRYKRYMNICRLKRMGSTDDIYKMKYLKNRSDHLKETINELIDDSKTKN